MSDDRAGDFVTALERPLIPSPWWLFEDESECDNLTGAGAFRGRDGARDFWSEDRSLFEEIRSTFRNVVEADGHVVLEWVREGTTRAGHPIRYEGASVLTLAGTRITRFKAYYDPGMVGRHVR